MCDGPRTRSKCKGVRLQSGRRHSPRHLRVVVVALAFRRVLDPDEQLALEEGQHGDAAPDRTLLLPRLALREDGLAVVRVKVGGEDARDARDAAVVVAASAWSKPSSLCPA